MATQPSSATAPTSDRIVVKFMAKACRHSDQRIFLRQFPGNQPRWGRCHFEFDPDATEYDWLVVCDDLAPIGSERFSKRVEHLVCPRENTLFITVEPSSIKIYGDDFLSQFGVVLTSQEPLAIPHPHAIYTQPSVRWFYGVSDRGIRTYDQMQAAPPSEKSRLISTVCSSKQQKHTLHMLRYSFTHDIRHQIPGLDLFGHGIHPIADKADALDPYKYHIAIENHVAPHHWTEKLSDAFLGLTLPFYFGCPNVADYFPEESFIPIDIRNVEAALERIKRALADSEYERRLPYIVEARRRVLEEYNLFAALSREIEKRHDDSARPEPNGVLLGRHAHRKKNLGNMIRYGYEKWRKRRLLNKWAAFDSGNRAA
jgi:glycosyl transferase family 10 (putative fucosyltransferase)